jgi:hypothetical protein
MLNEREGVTFLQLQRLPFYMTRKRLDQNREFPCSFVLFVTLWCRPAHNKNIDSQSMIMNRNLTKRTTVCNL